MRLICVLLAVFAFANAEAKEPKFTDYSVQLYKGAIKTPKDFVKSDNENMVQVNFAGRYYISTFYPHIIQPRLIDLSTGTEVGVDAPNDLWTIAIYGIDDHRNTLSLSNQIELTYERSSALLMIEYYTEYDDANVDNVPYRTVYFVFEPKTNEFTQITQIDGYPKDVMEFMRLRLEYEILGSEYEGYDGDEVDKEVTVMLEELDRKSDSALAQLKEKYKNNKHIVQKLNKYIIQ